MGRTPLLSFALFGVIAHASPVIQIRDSRITLPIATHINATGGTAALIHADKARFARLRAARKGVADAHQVTESVVDKLVYYTSVVPVGSPPTPYTLLVDTGSSNTWIGAGAPYIPTNTSHKTGDYVGVRYGSGSFAGNEFTDRIQIGSAVINQSIGVASTTTGFEGVDGILGIGPTDLTRGTLYPNITSLVPTITDNLRLQRYISSDLVAISFEPTILLDDVNGELDFGGVDSSKYTGPLNCVPVTSVGTAASYWGINQGITYGESTSILSAASEGIVDTGTTLLYLPSDAFARYTTATGGKLDNSTGLLQISPAQFASLKSLVFTIGRVKYEFTANAQIWPRHLNTDIGGSASAIYLIAADFGVQTGTGLDFINGFVWLQRFYTVFDTNNRRIGFANTQYTHATTN